MPITADFSNPPLSTDSPAVFKAKGVVYVSQFPLFTTQANILEAYVEGLAARAEAASAAAAVVATLWVSGTTYAIGDVRYSPADLQSYRRKTAGAGAIDPSLDRTNWTQISALAAPRNRALNGDARVHQLNSTVSCTAGAYTPVLDMWFVKPTGATVTVQQATASVNTETGLRTALQVNGAASVSAVLAALRIEDLDCQDLASRTVTVSAWVYRDATAGAGTATLRVARANAANNFGAVTAEFSGSAVAVGSGARVRVTATGTLSSNATTGLEIQVDCSGVGAGGQLHVQDLEIVPGSLATPADRIVRVPLALARLQCQRYFQRIAAPASGNPAMAAGQMTATTYADLALTYLVPMRVAPSVNHSGASSFRLRTGANLPLLSGLSFTGISSTGCTAQAAIASALTAGSGAVLLNEFGPSASYFELSARLL